MSGRLFIKGMKEPIFLNDTELSKAQVVKKDIALLDDAIVSIGGKWTGEKRDIKYVIADEVPKAQKEHVFSDSELEKFYQNDLKRFVVKKGDEQYKRFIDMMKKRVQSGQVQLYSWEIQELGLDTCSEEELEEKLEQLADKRVLGRFTTYSELLFLEHKQCVVVDWDSPTWTYSVVMHSTGDIPFVYMDAKLRAWKDYNWRKEREESVLGINTPPRLNDTDKDVDLLAKEKHV